MLCSGCSGKNTPDLYAFRAMKMSIWRACSMGERVSAHELKNSTYFWNRFCCRAYARVCATDWCFDDGKGCAMWWWSSVCKIVNTIFKMVIIDLTVCSIATHINNDDDERNEHFYGEKKNENRSDFNCVEYEECIFLLISFSHRKNRLWCIWMHFCDCHKQLTRTRWNCLVE